MSIVAEAVKVEPYFDMEMFLSISQETRIGGDLMDRLSPCWDEWVKHAHAVSFKAGDQTYLLVWLAQEVEDAIDAVWEKIPSDAYFYNALAQVMCMTMVHGAVPQVEDAGCAAAPVRGQDLADALHDVGVPYADQDGLMLSRRFAVLTHYPFKGGCEVCSLQGQCPKGSSCEPSTVLLPGHQ